MGLPDWAHLNKTSGTGNDTVKVTADPYTGRSTRGDGSENYITFTAGQNSVNTYIYQNPKPEFVTLSTTSFTVSSSGENITINGTSNSSKLTFSWQSGSQQNSSFGSYTANGSTATSGDAISGDPGASAEYSFSIVIVIPANESSEGTSTLVVTTDGGQAATALITQYAASSSNYESSPLGSV